MANEYFVASEPTYLSPETPPKHLALPSRSYFTSALCDTQPAPQTSLALDNATGRVVRVNISDLDEHYTALERRAVTLGASFETESDKENGNG